MYIPLANHHDPDSLLALTGGVTESQKWSYEFPYPKYAFSTDSAISSLCRVFARGLHAFTATLDHAQSPQKRDEADNINVTIGAVVGVLLAIFIAGAIAFLYVYGKSIRLRRRKKRRRRKSAGSKNSKSSKGEDGGGPPPPG
ncbi:hypothetical protein F4779DRAFT_326565 [Xylariaceae sp. FL0662B]|nr:hypothetical protein F4779DRAFT_326565 [Xylariaceae sp. FL0662B]